MNKELFVDKLGSLVPSIEDLQKYDLSDDYIKQLVNSYKCTIKPKPDFILNDDMFLALLNNYDCSKVEIGTITLIESPIEEVGFFQVGKVDLDILALDKITLQIVVLDHDSPEHVIWTCASNSNNFLEAILISAEYLTSKLKNLTTEEDISTILKFVNLCAEKAGGEVYIDFYKMLLGYFV